MLKSKVGKRVWILFAALIAVVFSLSAWLTFAPASDEPIAHAATNVSDERVTPLELMSVHNVDWVMGPIANKGTGANANKYVDASGNVLLDSEGYETNNVYKIPARQYFNIRNYIYISDVGTEKVLRGWKNNIKPVALGDPTVSISQNGNIVKNGVETTDLGIYITRSSLGGTVNVPTPSTNKYMLIMPDEITQIGTGSGAFNGKRPTSSNAGSTASSGTDYGFTDFAFYLYPSNGIYGTFDTNNNIYWSPRERLVGVYFNSTSNLKSIAGGESPIGSHRNNKEGKPAFAGCDNTKFFVLPNNNALTSIGNYAFYNCTQLRDINIPSTVNSIGNYAFQSCSSIPHLTISSSVNSVGTDAFAGMTKLSDVENHSSKVTAGSFSGSKLLNFYSDVNGSQLYVVGNDENDTGASGYYFCKNVRGYSGTLATATTNKYYVKDNWYVVALAGKDDTSATVVRKFPKSVTVNDARRSNILYDYLNSDGKKCTNALSETITKYDIGSGMADSTWCCNAVLPACVDIIGDTAFKYSHLVYLEMHATTVGQEAFYNNADVDTPGDEQNYYIHKGITNYGTNVFAGNPSGRTKALTRRFIFENKTVYNTYINTNGTLKTGNVFGSNNSDVVKQWRYQIPVIANVQSADGDVNIIEGDMDTRFDYDADYDTRKSVTDADANGNGTYKITYTKRLSGFKFDTVKTRVGTWTKLSSTELTSSGHSEPTIEDMESTQWYKNTTYTDANKATAADVAGKDELAVTSINIYTKKIAKPAIVNNTYTYDDPRIPSSILDMVIREESNPDYKTDYVATIKDFVYATTGTKVTDGITSVHNAGTYTIAISLNSKKWGSWTSDYQAEFTGEVTVKRQKIDLGDLKNLPTFSAGGVNLGGEGDGAALYRYDSGWYLYPQSGSQIGDTVYANNSYTRFTNSEIHLTRNEWSMYDIKQGSGDHYATASRDYYATFNLSVNYIDGAPRETNFEFVYTSEEENADLLDLYGLTLDNKKINEATLRKCWYIVMQSNWFIDSTATLDTTNPYDTPPYVLATKGEGENASSVRTWTYEDVVTVHKPKLAYNEDWSKGSAVTVSPTFSIWYSGAAEPIVTGATDLNKLSYYINSAMPAGTYTVVISAPAIQAQNGENYPAISDSIQIVVTPKALDAAELQAKLENGKKAYEHAYDTNRHLYYKDGDAKYNPDNSVDKELEILNNSLNGARKNAINEYNKDNSKTNYWITGEAADYFGVAQITYNLDRMGTSSYSAYDLAAPSTVDTYTVYYCISAKNYTTVGGENDANRRQKSFGVLIFNQIDISSLFIKGSDYLKDMEYDGTERHTSVPYNQFYRSEYLDENYIDARSGASVTITLLNPETSRWNYDITDPEQTARIPKPAEGAPADVIKAYYNITPAKNSWAVSPQMPSWSFNGFNPAVNVVSSGLMFPGADVMYRLGTTDEDGATVWTKYFKVNADGAVIAGYALGEDGSFTVIPKDDIISELNLLKPGNYYLQSKVGDITAESGGINVLGGEFVAQSNNGWLATVNISKATNRWTRSPNIVRWTWNEYIKTRHIISATSLYPAVLSAFFADNNIETYAAEYQILKYIEGEGGNYSTEGIVGLSVDADGKELWFTVVTDEIAEILGGLNAGDYVLRARLNGNEYYYDIEEQDNIFDITRTNNTWEATPGVSGWQYQAFSSENLLFGVPKYYAELGNVTYTLALRSGAEFTFGGESGTSFDLDYTVTEDENGNDVFTLDAATVAAFEGLAVGNYKVTATLAEDANNYSDLDYTATFSVIAANNSWDPEPGMTSWMYGTFTVDGNFTAGAPKLAETLVGEGENKTPAEVMYTINKANGEFTPITFTESQLKANNGDNDIVTRIKELHYGSYTLDVEYAGTANYAKLERSITFSVTQTTNTWEITPGMSGWAYKSFRDTNFRDGVPTRNEVEGAKVKYAVYAGDFSNGELDPAKLLFDFEALDDKMSEDEGAKTASDMFTELEVLSDDAPYTLVATLVGNADYNPLEQRITFKVAQLTNTWETTPAMSGWVYSSFAVSNFTPGVPTIKESVETVGGAEVPATVKYAITKPGDGTFEAISFTAIDDVKAALEALDYGTYRLTATYAGTNNYAELPYSVDFMVSEITNRWTTTPRITSYQYKSFDSSSNFIAGVPMYPTDATDKKVYYAILDHAPASEPESLADFQALGTHNFENISEIVGYLNTLNGGEYYFAAYAPAAANGNYSDIFSYSEFRVNSTTNAWQQNQVPAITGWTYGAYNNNLTPGAANHGEVVYSVQNVEDDNIVENSYAEVVVDGETVELKQLSASVIKAYLELLGAGRYNLKAETVESADFASATHNVRFTVAKAANGWATTPPSISDWTYGDEANNPVPGTADVDTGEITYEYYKAIQVNGEWIADKNNKVTSLVNLPAGSYAMVVTVPESANYLPLVHTATFIVNKYINVWENEPEIALGWTWGEAETYLADKKFIDPSAKLGKEDRSDITYAINKTSGGTYNVTVDFADIEETLNTLGVGVYEVIVKVAGTDNYNEVIQKAMLTVTPASFSWVTGKEPTDSGWTWDDADADKTIFEKPDVVKAVETDEVTIKYAVTTTGEEYDDYDKMLADVLALDAGTHRITISVSNPNYNPFGKQITVTIAKADFNVDTAPKNAEWFWNDKWTEAAGGRNIVMPAISDKSGNNVELAYQIIGVAEVSTYAEAVAYLQSNDCNAGTYSVRVWANKDNYNNYEETFTVQIKKAENKWLDGKAPQNTITKEYQQNIAADQVVIAEALFGEVKYGGQYTGTSDGLLDWINSLSSGTFTFTTAIDETVNYNGFTVTTTVQVLGIGAAWDNQTALDAASDNLTFTYSSELSKQMKTVVIPRKTPPQGVEATLEYRVRYVPNATFGDAETQVFETADEVEDYLTRSTRGAGVYTVIATYTPKDTDNYATLGKTITVTVNRGAIAWSDGTQPQSSYSRAYQDFDNIVLTPTAGAEHIVKYTVTGSKTDEFEAPSNFKLSDYLNGLDVGEYTITYRIELTNNYPELAAETFSVHIIKASNEWIGFENRMSTIIVYRGDEFNLVVPKGAQRGTVVITVTRPGAAQGSTPSGDLNEWLAEQDYPASAQQYKVSFTVAGTENYNGLSHDCMLTISKKTNAWATGKSPEAEYVWYGEAGEFKIPVAEKYSELLRFDIQKKGDSKYNKQNLTEDEFDAALKEMVYGSYTVTMRIGSNDEFDSDADIRTYNRNYVMLSGTTDIVFERGENEFTKGLQVKTIIYNDTVTIEPLKAKYGEDAIVYTVTGTKANGDAVSLTFNTANDTETEKAFDKFVAALNSLEAGSYTVKARIEQTDTYGFAETSVLYTVNKITTVWSGTPSTSDLTCTWGALDSTLTLPTLSVANWDGADAKIKYYINGAELSDDTTTSVNEGTWLGALSTRNAGTYILSAKVEGDNNHTELTFEVRITVDKVVTAWTESVNDGEKLSWTYDDATHATLPTLTISNWTGGKIVYTVTKPNGGTEKIDNWNVYANGLDAGSYTFTATVEGDANHTDLTYTATVDIAKFVIAWNEESATALEATKHQMSWDYGSEHDDLPIPTANFGKVTYTIVIGGVQQNVAADKNWNDALAELHNGTYRVTAMVAGDINHEGVSYEIVVTINKITTVWENQTALEANNGKVSWTWSADGSTTVQLPIPTPNWNGAVVKYYISTNGGDRIAVETGKTWNDALANKPAGEYVVTAEVDEDTDHSRAVCSITVTINKIVTAWDAITASSNNTSLSWTWSEDGSTKQTLPTPTANWDATVKYYINGTSVGTGKDWNSELVGKDAGTYVMRAEIDGDANHTGITCEITVTINKITTTWTNQTELAATNGQAEWNHGATPNLPIPDPSWGTVVYYITIDGVQNKVATGTWNDTLVNRVNGTYRMYAKVEGDANHTALDYEIVVTIKSITTAWENQQELDATRGEMSWTWSEDGSTKQTLPTPIPNWNATVKYYMEANGGSKVPVGTGKDWNSELVGKDAGTYVMYAEVNADENHSGLSYKITVTINKITTTWTNQTELEAYQGLAWNYGATPNLPIPDPSWGTVSYKVTTGGTTSEISEGNWNTWLTGKGVGTYKVTATFNGDENHTPVTYEYTITIGTVSAAWKAAPANGATYTWTYDADKGYTDIPQMPELTSNELGAPTFTLVKSGATGNLYSGTDFAELIVTLKNQTAGTYTITASISGDANHEAPSDHTQTVTINVRDNEWLSHKSADEKISWVYNAADNVAIEYEAKYNNDDLVIRVNNSRITLNDDQTLTDYLKGQPAGSYTINVSVQADDKYGALSETVTLTISLTANGWKDGDLSIKNEWEWADLTKYPNGGSDFQLKLPEPNVGDSVIIYVDSVTENNGSTVRTSAITMTLGYPAGVMNENDVVALKTRLWKLDAGKYEIHAEIAATGNYNALVGTTVEFVISVAHNTWNTDPSVDGWSYGANLPKPNSDPKFGNKNDVVYTYAKATDATDDECKKAKDLPDSDWTTVAPNAKGAYYLRAVLAATNNYTGLTGYYLFQVDASTNEWVDVPGVTAWNWNGYDREINLFRASAQNGGKVTFAIKKIVNGNVEALGTSDFYDADGKTFTSQTVDKLNKFGFEVVGEVTSKFVSNDIAELLKALKPGRYTLRATAAGDENFAEKSGDVEFNVGKANNEWKTAPNILSFVYGNIEKTGDRKSFTAGVTKYGANNVLYRIRGNDNNGTAVDSGAAGKNAAGIEKDIEELAAGSYSLQMWATGGDTYNAFYTVDAPYSVLFAVTRDMNAWATGKGPQDSITTSYVSLKDLTDIGVMYTAPVAISKTEVEYSILGENRQSIVSELEYGELLDELKKLHSGNYIIRANVAVSCNYGAVSGETAISITRLSNALTYKADGKAFATNTEVNGKWRKEGGNDITAFREVVAKYGDVVYTLGGNDYTYEAITEYLATVNAGNYNIVLSVETTNRYEGFTNISYILNIEQADNSWIGGWTIGTSIKDGDAVATQWEWSTDVTWVGAKPLYGSTVYVKITTVTKGVESDSALRYYTISTTSNFETQVDSVSEAISNLGAGTYYLTVTAPADTNWKALEANDVCKQQFTVVKTESNVWTSEDGEHEVDPMLVNSLGESVMSWDFGTSVRAVANAAYGSWQVEYFDDDGNELSGMPTNAGSYKAVFTVDATNEYNKLEKEINFTINKISYEAYSVVPGIVSWTWDDYDRTTNLFTGIARSGGNVSFEIRERDGDAAITVNGNALTNIELVDEKGTHTGDTSKDIYVPVNTAELIEQLLGGQYTLIVNFATTTNYLAFSTSVDFTIATVRNEWTTTPSVSPWAVNHWDAESSTPKAESLYGNPTIIITYQPSGEVFYRAEFDPEKGEDGGYNILNRLNSAKAGWYTMKASVANAPGKYNNTLNAEFDFQIFVMGSPDAKNGWLDTPSIKAWNANLDGVYGEITGSPIRGLPYFEFYKAIRNESGALVMGTLIEDGKDSIKVEAGTKYYKDFYVPCADGAYYMVAKAVYESADGTIADGDEIDYAPIYFEIGNRDNSFTQDVRIATLMYLGDIKNWQLPTVAANLQDSEYEFEYFNAVTKELVSKGIDIPRVAGQYILRVTAKATYSKAIVSEIEFAVEYSQNSWVGDKSPTIDNWSEEFSNTAPDPVGEAKYGTIEYTYTNVKTGETKKEKPLTAGTYILNATVKLDGYITLTSSYEFTVEEAFDRTFVLIDIILGFVACAFAVVVIIFAVRRYKENG